MRASVFATTLLLGACHGPRVAVHEPPPRDEPPVSAEPIPCEASPCGSLESDAPLLAGDVLQVAEGSSAEPEGGWTVGWAFPVGVGYSSLELGEGIPRDWLTTLTLVPTLELRRPLTEKWTLVPFVGLGGGWLVNEDKGLGILTTGVSAEWRHEFSEESVLRVVPRIRYDANLNLPDGLLGDWGRSDVSVELRRALGEPGDTLRLEPGIYGQVLWFWDDVEFEVPGVTPDSVEGQQEFGFSLGTREPLEFFGLAVPRIFFGYRFGDGVTTLSIRIGEL